MGDALAESHAELGGVRWPTQCRCQGAGTWVSLSSDDRLPAFALGPERWGGEGMMRDAREPPRRRGWGVGVGRKPRPGGGQTGGICGRELAGLGVAPMLGGQEGESKGHHNTRAPDAQRKFSSRGPNRVRPPGLPAQGLGPWRGRSRDRPRAVDCRHLGGANRWGRGKWGVGMRRGS